MAKYISERDKRVKERESLYRQAGYRTQADSAAQREEETIRLSQQYADSIMPRVYTPSTPAERYAQSRTSPDRKLNAMERRLDSGTSVQTTNSAKREFERDTDAVIKARENATRADNSAYRMGTVDPVAYKRSTKQNSQYEGLAEEYRKKYNLNEKEYENALKNREAQNANNKVIHEQAKTKAAYNKYSNLSDDEKKLVADVSGKGMLTSDASLEAPLETPDFAKNELLEESRNKNTKKNAKTQAYEELRKKYSDEEIKELKKGYKDSQKYGTPITENEELKAKYDSLDGTARSLIRDAYDPDKRESVDPYAAMFMSDKPESVELTHARERLKAEYGLTDDEITQLAIYAHRYGDAQMGNAEFAEQIGKEAAQDLKGVASIASIGGNVIGAVTSPMGLIRDAMENKRLKDAGYEGDLTLNPDNPYYIPGRATKAIREQRAEDLNKYWGTEKLAGFVYQTAMSGADSLVAARIGSLFPAVNFGGTINGVKNAVSIGAAAQGATYSMGMGGLMLGVGAGIDTMLDLTDKGASAETAVMGGLVAGTFEMLFEDLSISRLDTFSGIEALNMAKGFSRNAVKQNVKIAAEKILGSAVTNASEEGLTELANLIYDTLANGDMSQYTEYYNNAIANGLSTDDARKEAFKDMALQVLEAAAGGALMGVGFGVGGAVKLNAQRNTTYAMSPDGLVTVTPKMKGRAISDSGRVGETLQAADVVGGEAWEYKNKLLAKAGGESNLTEKEIGKIALETQFATEGNEEKRKALKSFREEAEVKRANYKQGTTENGNKTRYLITNSPITVDGKETTINGNNKVDTEGEVFTDGKNGLEFKTGDGRTVELTRQTASQIKNEDARNLALFAVNNNLKAKSANLLFNTYDGEFLARDHASAFLNIYRQGSLGTKNKALIKNYSESLSKFTADQVNEIMNAGLEEKKFTPGATDFRVTEKKNNFVNIQVKIMDSIAKALNKELIVTDDLFDEYTREDGTKGYRALNGTYIKGDNRIILSAKADNGLLLSFLAHEMGHEMKNIDSDAFGRLKEKVKSYYTPEEFEEMKAEFVLKGYKESEAEEEIIANALFKVWDKDTIKKVVGKNKSLAVKLYNLVDKISKTYDKAIQRFTTGTDRYGNERNADVKKLLDNKQFMDDVKEVFTEYIGNMQSGKYDTTAEGGLNAIANTAEKEVVKEFGDNLGEVITDGEGDLVLATDKNEETAMYSYSTWQDRGRDELIGLLKAKGHTATEIKDVISQIEDAADYLKILAAGDAKNAGYDALADHLIADVVTDVANGKQIVSALVPNGDYPVNIDLALICKKRVAYMKLLNYLVGEGVLENVKFGGEAIADVNKILRDSGFETACLGCFVESRRLQIQTWAETIAQEWNAAVDKVRKNAPYFNFSDKEGVANLTEDEVNGLESWLDKQIKNDKGNVKAPGKTPTTKAGNLLKMLKKTGEGEAFNALAKKITVGDLITPQGLTKLRSVSGELFSFVKSRYGAASPKIVQDFNPYNSEIAMMTFEAVKKITGKSISGSQSYLSAAKEELADSKPPKKDKAGTEKWNADVQNLALQKYFKDIGGIRIQSFSDFMIENVFDYLQIVADLSARDFTMHGYTKEASAIRLFGMTGIKWNGSLIAHVDPKMGKEFAGLMPASEAKAHRGIPVKVDGKEYSIGFDDFERHSKFDKNSFIQSIGYKDMVALQCDKRYSPYVGSICIGVSDKQIEAMLDSDLIRMIIPYHASGMLPEFANLIGVDMYTDYTNYQNTRIEKLFDVNGTPVTELVIGKDKKGKDEYAGNKQVGHFEWNAKVQELGDAKAAAKAYIEWCHEQHPVFNKKGDLIGYATYEPKFSQFSNHENYYKLLEDFNSYDSVTGVSAVQDAVKMNLPSKDNKLTAKELAEYKQALKKTGLFSDSEIEKYAKKAQMSFQDIIKESVDERIAYNKMTEPIKQETFEKVKDLLLTKYNRNGNRAASIDDYLNAQKSPKTKSTLQPVEGAYGNKNSISDREYFDAIDEYSEDSKEVKKMVEQAAKDWGAYTNNKGIPVVGYHATPYSFNTFDIEKTSKTNDLGQGIYITSDVNDAKNNYAKASGGDVQNKIESRALEIFEEMGFTEEDSYSNDYVKEYNEAYDRAEKEFNDGKIMPLFFKITNPLYVKGSNLVDENGNIVVETQYADYKKLLQQGYDGIVDNTVSSKFSNIKSADTTHYVVLDNRNVKSADSVTYDDKGNIIPLSERFNAEETDIRYSYSDREYFDAIEKYGEDSKEVANIVRKAAEKNGYKGLNLYHGTDGRKAPFGFTKIDFSFSDDGQTFFMTDSLEGAATYSGTRKTRKISDTTAKLDAKSDKAYQKYLDKRYDVARLLADEIGWTPSEYSWLQSDIESALEDVANRYYDGFIAFDRLGENAINEIADRLNETFENSDIDLEVQTSGYWEDIRDLAETWMDYFDATTDYDQSNQGIYNLYVDTSNYFEYDAKGNRWNDLDFEVNGVPYNMTRDVAKYALDNGYNGVIIRNVIDNGNYGDTPPINVYVAFSSNQVKSADPVTYDDNGNIIPLSERFNKEEPDIRYSYAGDRAETADRDLLSEAEQMEKDGADSETIRQKTGWFRGYDNKWRFEIDDSKATWNDEARLRRDVYDTGYDYVKLVDLMDHPELYAAYPELKNVKIYIRPNQLTTGMVYGGSTDAVFMKEYRPSSEIWRDFFTHELQHIVQNIEEFAPGSSQEMFKQLDWGEKEYAAVDKRNELADKLYAILRRHGTKISNEEIEDNRYAWTDGFVSSIINREYFKLSRLADSNKRTRELLDEYYKQAWILNSTTPYGQYMNTAGEIEANDTMGRRRLSADDRRRLRPNIDNENAIVLGDNAAKYSYRDLDSEYEEAYFDGDDERMQEIIDEAAIDAGYKYKAYHHTENSFTKFDLNRARKTSDIQGFYFSADPEAESEFGNARYDVYLRMRNPYVVDSTEKAKAIPFDLSKDNSGVEARQWLLDNGYDSVIRKAEYYGAEADEYIVLNANQIKSSEPVTYDGEDEIIYPSQRFDDSDEDIRYSLSERGDVEEYEAEQLLNTAKGEDAKAIVDAVDRELLGDAMYYGRKSEQLREEKNAAKKEVKSLNSKVETRNRQIAALRQKVKDQRLADDIYYQRRIKEIRDDRDQKILALKAARRQQDINKRENKLIRDYRSRIQKTYDNLSKELLKPNANRYVPAGLVKTVSDVLGTLSDTLQTTDYYTQGKREGQEIKSRVARNKRLADLKVAYDALENDKNYSQVYDPVISDMIQVMNETIKDKTIEEMNAKELEQVYTVLKAIDHTVRKAAKVEIAGREADAFKLADKSIDQLKEVKKKKINAISKFWYEQLNPRSFFRQLAGYTDGGWMDTYEILNNGQLQQTAIRSEITEAFRELTGDKRARELMDTDKLVDIGLRDAYGKPIPITRGMMISLYMHLQNEDNTRHIERDGLTVPDIDKYYKGDSEAFGNNIARSAGASAELRYLNHQLSELREKRKTAENTMALDAQIEELEERYNIALEKADILSENLKLNIERELTDYDRAWIAKAKWLFDEYSKGKLNEATMRMYGFRKANVENYMPIRTDETDRAPTFEGVKRDVSLENSGFMKDRQKGASNAIYLEDIVDVIQRQMDNVATYSGLAPAVKDFEKIYGKSKLNQDNEVLTTSSVQGAVRDTFGRYGMKYVHDLVTDLQGGRRKEPSIISTLRGNAYQAALTLNLRVAMAQAGSYPTAAAEIGWKPLMQALAKGGEKGKPLSKADRELIAKYTPLLANRINGGHNTVAMGDSGNRSAVDINNLKLMSSKSAKGLNARILNKTAVLTDWIAKVDAATVGRLWYACQYYVDAQSPNLEKGSDEYYQEVAKVFNRVVERTQPSYTTMQRSALLRNPNEAMKLFTMYMTQRAQNFNLVYDSAMEYHTLRQSGASEEKLKESRSKLGRVVSSQLAAGLTLSAMKIVADAIQHSMKGYRDDDDEVTLAKILEKLGLTWLESELSNIFLASEIYSAVSKAITGETYYGISVNVTGALTDLTKSLVTMAQNPSPSTIDKAFRNAATILGIPSSQMKKFADMGIYWFEDIKDGGGIYSYSENGSSVKTETTKMVKQFLNGDMENYRKTRESLKGENASTVKSHIVTYLRENYVDGKLTDQEVRRVLESVYGMSSTNISKKLEEFRQRKNGTYEKKESKKWGEE